MTAVLRFDAARGAELREHLRQASFRFEERPHALFLARREGVTLTAYKSGKLLLTGPQAAEFAGVLVGRGLAEGEAPAPPADAEDVGGLVVHFDGLCYPFNPGGVAAWGFAAFLDGREVHSAHGVAAPPGPGATNNVAEYRALIEALRWLVARGRPDEPVRVRGDSDLIIGQARGERRVAAPRLVEMNEAARALLARLPRATLEWVPRERNARADELSRVAYDDALRAHPEWRALLRRRRS